MSPRAAPISVPRRNATPIGKLMLRTNIIPTAIPLKPRMDPTERSMFLVTMTIISPIETTTMSGM